MTEFCPFIGSGDTSHEAVRELLEWTVVIVYQQFADAESASVDETIQLKRARTIGYLANQHRKLLRDTDLDTMDESWNDLRNFRAKRPHEPLDRAVTRASGTRIRSECWEAVFQVPRAVLGGSSTRSQSTFHVTVA